MGRQIPIALIFLQAEKHIKVYTRQGFLGIPSAWKKHNIPFAWKKHNIPFVN
jgi:hypothetical protein